MDAEAPLFGEGLGLDSIDALELVAFWKKITASRSMFAKEGLRYSTP